MYIERPKCMDLLDKLQKYLHVLVKMCVKLRKM